MRTEFERIMWPDGEGYDTFGRKLRSRRSGADSRACSRFVSFAMKRFGRCQWCNRQLSRFGNTKKTGQPMATADHLIAKSLGGSNKFSNLCLSCSDCNNERGSAVPIPRKYGPQDWGLIQKQERDSAASLASSGSRPTMLDQRGETS